MCERQVRASVAGEILKFITAKLSAVSIISVLLLRMQSCEVPGCFSSNPANNQVGVESPDVNNRDVNSEGGKFLSNKLCNK